MKLYYEIIKKILGAKLSVFIILVPNCLVPNCLGAKLSGAKLSGCQIVRCQIVRPPKEQLIIFKKIVHFISRDKIKQRTVGNFQRKKFPFHNLRQY